MTQDRNRRHLTTSSRSKPAASADITPGDAAEIFARMGACVGASAMYQMIGGIEPQDLEREWSAGLAGFSSSEIDAGLAAVRSRRFPPNLAEFRELCRPGLNPEAAWLEAERGIAAHARGQRFPWSHPAVFWAAQSMNYEIRTSNLKTCGKRWAYTLERMWSSPDLWEPIPDPTARRLEQPKQGALVPGVAEEALAKINRARDQLARRLAAQPVDTKRSTEERDVIANVHEKQKAAQERVEAYARAHGIKL